MNMGVGHHNYGLLVQNREARHKMVDDWQEEMVQLSLRTGMVLGCRIGPRELLCQDPCTASGRVGSFSDIGIQKRQVCLTFQEEFQRNSRQGDVAVRGR